MRLEHLKQIAGALTTANPLLVTAKAVIVTEVERLHWRIWNGKAKNAQKSIDRIRAVMHYFRGEPDSRKSTAPSRKLWTALHALDGYLTGQSAWLVNYAERHRASLRVGTAITEGTANFLVNRQADRLRRIRQRLDRHPASTAGGFRTLVLHKIGRFRTTPIFAGMFNLPPVGSLSLHWWSFQRELLLVVLDHLLALCLR
jgi:hypothetical protein